MAYLRAEHISKRFQLRRDRADSVGGLLMRMLPGRRPPPAEPFWALRDVSFEMGPGVSFGIVGNNGSGKSTLLKIVTRTMLPTTGRIAVEGRVSALIELGAGFHPDFTGRENVYLNASILGIPRRQIERKMEEIIDFAEIRPFIDTPVKYYSSGMHARLGFAVATSVEPDLLIVDEVLAVGDEAFQQKCMDRIFRMKREGVNILLVSHDLGSIERLMDQALWLDRGVMRAQGRPRDVVHAYREALIGADAAPAPADGPEPAAPALELVSAHCLSQGRAVDQIRAGDPLTVEWTWACRGPEVFQGALELSLRRPDGLEIARWSQLKEGRQIAVGPGQARVALDLDALWLATGQYEFDCALFDGQGRRIWEARPLLTLRVQALDFSAGLVLIPHRWRVEA
ncbi:MAG: ATP-binding cassette domain-containing protein [Firmicutes bacterium]|nr:ATP-binding cassette domain-containing protein [Alicyclobacillaceae bacterium]MCL6497093.1 ATP-binding cassette domain-containing protein [Bacillota bacterium]